ncbi:unnamed protein product [Sphenostylis stenocarpa]|uniref:TIR domain-containing protein n=1 Tax=Sphenostylis stenocarpa TaxID=92480 RepID=A0AA86VK43_9FABA|nr:unnamed protein product [Sphenostylis stenocarpa]
MASRSSCHAIKHDVFISFRGTDVRKGLLSHLRKELRRRQIDVYVDERLERGDEILPSLLRAIEESQISLIIFSKDYASSKCCLEELAKIIDCKQTNKQIVLSVFFNVDPSDVRNQQGDYGDAFAQHEEKLKDNGKVQRWRSALRKAGRLSGFHYPTNFEDESDLIDKIVEDIAEKLSKFYPSETYGLVAIDQHIEKIQSLLMRESNEVMLVGLWGMGGIGEDKDYVISQLDAWGFHGASGIEVLQKKALITISNDNRIQMHDLIRQMGCEIVRQESIKYPGRRSRLWDSEEVYDVLRHNLGTDEVEAMKIDLSQFTDLPLRVDTLKNMPGLRFLKLYYPLHIELSMPPSRVKAMLLVLGL